MPLLMVTVTLFLTLSLTPAARMLCEPPRPAPDELRRADAVFSGRAISQEYVERGEAGFVERLGGSALATKFRVGRWWKGGAAEEVIVYTSALKKNDGILTMAEDARFQVGESYLVYAFGPADELRTRSCTRTVELGRAGEDVRQLGGGYEPEEKGGPGGPAAKPNIGMQRTRNKAASSR